MSNELIYDVAIAGAGAAGMMAAIRAAELNKKIVLIERNSILGKKILLTGCGRCNVTNIASLDVFIEKFGRQGEFLRSAFFVFSNKDLMNFFESKGLKLKIERQGRVFPEDDRSFSVVNVLRRSIFEKNVKVILNSRIQNIEKIDGIFELKIEKGDLIKAKKVILATGGASYKNTGSSGDGFVMAKRLRHAVTLLSPGLVPLKTKEIWTRELQGLTLENVRIAFDASGKKITSGVGELLFTHFGVSGPLVLDLSYKVAEWLKAYKEVRLNIDLKPGLEIRQIEDKLLRYTKDSGAKSLKNILKDLLPIGLISIFIKLLNIEYNKKINQLTRRERDSIIKLLKIFPLTIIGTLPLEEAMVTCGGVSLKEINPRTMESKIVEGLYFSGEVIEGAAPSGGYNLQQAFSTGYLAAESAAFSLEGKHAKDNSGIKIKGKAGTT